MTPSLLARTETGSAPGAALELPLRFEGAALEYFRIWIVNLCLSLLTLGVFSAWAKVRTERYFHSCTTLDGSAFEYLGRPLPILRGRTLGVTLLGALYAAVLLDPAGPWRWVALGAFGGGAPWLLVQAARFRARCTSYRNRTFDFSGSSGRAAAVLYGWGVLTLLTLGLAWPWLEERTCRFLATRSEYGGVHPELATRGRQYAWIYLKCLCVVLPVGVAVAAFWAALRWEPGAPLRFSLDTGSSYLSFAVGYAYLQARLGNLRWSAMRLGPLRFESRLRVRGLLWIYLSNAAVIVPSLGLAIPWARVRLHRYRIACLAVVSVGDLPVFRATRPALARAEGAQIGELFGMDLAL